MWKLCKKYAVFIALIVTALGYGAIQLTHAEPVQKNTQLVVGLESGYPPFDFKDSNGNIIGFDVDVAKLIAGKLNKQLVIKDMDFDGIILSLKQGKADLLMCGLNITPSRLKEILMVPYHGEAIKSFSLIFWGKIPQGIQKLEDIGNLPNGAVSVQSGAVSEAYLSKMPSIRVKSFQGALAPLMDVKFGKSTANLVEADTADYLKSQHPEITILDVPLPEEEQILGFGIGIKKENQELFQQVSSIIQELKKSGELKKLEEKWFKDEGYSNG